MCIFECIFYTNNTAKGNTSLILNKLLGTTTLISHRKIKHTLSHVSMLTIESVTLSQTS